MILLPFVLLLIFGLLVLCEYLWRTHKLHGEGARKFIHIIVGTFVATWPFYLSWNAIFLISVAFLVVVVVSRHLGFFKSLRAIERKSWGEHLFALGIGITSLITREPWIFAAAILHLSLADGAAGLVGSRYGKSTTYKILGHNKSVVGTLTFYFVSVLIIALATTKAGGFEMAQPAIYILLPIATTLLENVGIYGTDNILVPLVVAGVLNTVQL